MALFPYLSHFLSLLCLLASQFGTSVGAKTLTLKQAVLVSGVCLVACDHMTLCFLTGLPPMFCLPMKTPNNNTDGRCSGQDGMAWMAAINRVHSPVLLVD